MRFTPTWRCALCLTAAALAAAASASAGKPTGVVTDAAVETMAVDQNRLLLGGSFAYVGPLTGAATTIDARTGRRISGSTVFQGSAIASTPDGAGGFYVAVSRGHFPWRSSNLVRLDADGRLDPTFRPDGDLDPTSLVVGGVDPTSLALGEGRLYAAVVGRVVALDPVTGRRDPGFEVRLGYPFVPSPLGVRGSSPLPPCAEQGGYGRSRYGTPTRIAVGDGRVYLAGSFTSANREPRMGLAAVDARTGEVSRSFDPGGVNGAEPGSRPSDANGLVRALEFVDGRVIVGGEFSAIGGHPRRHFAALDPETGRVDPEFGPQPPGVVSHLAVADGRIYVATDQRGAGKRSEVDALDARTGAPAPGFVPRGVGSVDALAAGGGRLFAATVEVRSRSRPETRITSLPTGASQRTAFSIRADNPVASLSVSGDRLVVVGLLQSLGGDERVGLAALDLSTGRIDPRVGLPEQAAVSALLLHGHRAYVSARRRGPGAFGGALHAIDLRSNGPVPGFEPPQGAGGGHAIARWRSRLFVANEYGYRLRAYDVRDGRRDEAFRPDMKGLVTGLVVARDRLYIAGRLYLGETAERSVGIVALDPRTGRIDRTFRAPSDIARVTALTHGHGRLYAAAELRDDYERKRRVVALEVGTGSEDPAFYALDFRAYRLLVVGRKLYGASRFPRALVALDRRTGSLRSRFAPGLDDAPCALAVAHGRLFAGGRFHWARDAYVGHAASISLVTGRARPLP